LGGDQEDTAIALLALLSGGVTMARSVSDPSVSERLAGAVRKPALRICVGSEDSEGEE
jgi:TetR/AcrR family transcriptional repressor of nem operon